MNKEFLSKLNVAFGMPISESRGLVMRPGIVKTRRRSERLARRPLLDPKTMGGHTIVADHIAVRPWGLKIGIGFIPNSSDYKLANGARDKEFSRVEPNPEYLIWKERVLDKMKPRDEREQERAPGDDWDDVFSHNLGGPRRNRVYPLFEKVITILRKNIASLEWA